MVGSTDACYISIPYCSACSNLRYSNSHLAACLCAWKAAEDDPSTWDPASLWETPMEFLVSGFNQAQIWLFGHF